MDEKYPDARPMGYPFDRRLYISEKGQGPAFLEHLVRDVPNMAFSHIKVVHFDELRGGFESDFQGDGDYHDVGNPVGHQYIDDDHHSSIGTDSPSPFSEVIHINGRQNSLSSPHTRLVTSPISIESPIHIDGPEHTPGPPPGPPLGPPPPPPPPPRTILDLRLEHSDSGATRESAPNFHSGSDSNSLDEFIPNHHDHIDAHENIRSAIHKINPPPPPHPPPPPPPHFFGPHPDAQTDYIEESLAPVKRPYRSAFRSSFRSLLKTFSPIGPMGGPPKSVLSLLG